MKEFKLIQGTVPADYEREPPYHENHYHIAALLTRAQADGWWLVHTHSYSPISLSQYERPTFYCLLEREASEFRDGSTGDSGNG